MQGVHTLQWELSGPAMGWNTTVKDTPAIWRGEAWYELYLEATREENRARAGDFRARAVQTGHRPEIGEITVQEKMK
jgi:hypothetical protein